MSEWFSTGGPRVSAGNGTAAACVIQGMEELIVDGFFWLAFSVGEFLLEFARDLWEVTRECSWPNARAERERLVRLRSWNERVQRSLEGSGTGSSR